MSAGVITANISWKTMNAEAGTVGARTLGAAPTPRRPRYWSPPVSVARSGPNASVYPTRTHRTVTTPSAISDCITVPRTFFARTSPP